MEERTMSEDDYPDYTIALVNFRYGDGSVRKEDTPFVKWGSEWDIPGSDEDGEFTLQRIVEKHVNVRVLKPGSHEWIHVS